MSDVTTKIKDEAKEALRGPGPVHPASPGSLADFFPKLPGLFWPTHNATATFEITHSASQAYVRGHFAYADGSPTLYFHGSGTALRQFGHKKLVLHGVLPPPHTVVGPSFYWFSITPVLASCGFYNIFGSMFIGPGATEILLPLFGNGHFTLTPPPQPK
jgi:hypothetical protein